MSLWELLCFLKSPDLAPHREEAVPLDHPSSPEVTLQDGRKSKSTLSHLKTTKVGHQLSQNLRTREIILVAAQ